MVDNVPIPQNIGTVTVTVTDTSGPLRNLLISMLARVAALETQVTQLKSGAKP